MLPFFFGYERLASFRGVCGLVVLLLGYECLAFFFEAGKPINKDFVF
jgi:hypothetical protein